MMISSVREDAKRRKLAGAAVLAFAVGGLVLSWASAHATTLDPVTISAPAVKVVGRERLTNAPLQQTRISAHVGFKPVTLTTNSGVALLRDSVRNAAFRVCAALGPDSFGTCVIRAEQSAQPQVDAAITRARSATKG
jgi:UrcA family protein